MMMDITKNVNKIKKFVVSTEHLLHVLGPLYYHLLIPFLEKTKIVYDDVSFWIYLPRHGLAVSHAIQLKCYEPAVTRLIWDMLEEESVFWDIGGSVGYYSVLAARKIRDSRDIHVFEPGPINIILKHNLHSFGINANLNSSYVNSIADLGKHISCDYYAEKSAVSPDMIKIDIEGWEVEALKGMNKALRKKPFLFVEVHPIDIPSISNENHEFIFNYLGDLGYSVVQLINFRDFDWCLKSIEDLSDLPISPPNNNYMIFCYAREHSEKLSRYENRWK